MIDWVLFILLMGSIMLIAYGSMIDWVLFILLMGSIMLIAYGSYREGVEEGWRQAGRWADDLHPDVGHDRPATRLDDDGNPPYSIL